MLATQRETVCDGKRLRSARLGSGPPVVLLHGYPDNLQIWSRIAPILAERFEVIAFDWPGMGYSDPWAGGTTPAHQADRLRDLLDHWRIDRAHIVGFDMGGQPALLFASRHGERIDRLVVMNSLTHGDAKTSWEIRLLRQFGWNRVILRRLPWIVFRRAERTFLPPGVRLPPEIRADLWESFRRPAVRKFIVRLCAGYQGTLSRLPDAYRKIACPTLALWGEADCHFPPVHADRLAQDIPGAQKILLPGATHWMMWDRAEEAAGHVAAFLGGRLGVMG